MYICSLLSVLAALFTIMEAFLTVKHVLQPLDLKLLVFVMESLTVQKGELDNANSRLKWSDRVRTVSPVVRQLLDSVDVQKYADRVNVCRYLLFYNLLCMCALHDISEVVDSHPCDLGKFSLHINLLKHFQPHLNYV